MKQQMTYAEQLNHLLWKRKASFIRERDDFKCVQCGTEGEILHVHHKYPQTNKLAWEYPNDELETLCENCHAWETMYQRIPGHLTNGLVKWFGLTRQERLEYERIKSLPRIEALAIFEEMVKKNPLNDEALLMKLKSILQKEQSQSKSLHTNHS